MAFKKAIWFSIFEAVFDMIPKFTISASFSL